MIIKYKVGDYFVVNLTKGIEKEFYKIAKIKKDKVIYEICEPINKRLFGNVEKETFLKWLNNKSWLIVNRTYVLLYKD
mgnify:CR=1 FL=1